MQKLCEALGGEQCTQKNVTLFLASQKISTTEFFSENNFYALLAFLGCISESSDEEEEENVLEAIMIQKQESYDVEVKPKQVLPKEMNEDAKDVRRLTEMMEIEKAIIQSYQDNCFAKYMETNPCDENTSLRIK